MNGKERILARLQNGTPDSLPLMPITMMYAGDIAGIPYGVYARNHEALVQAQLAVADRFDFDYVSAISDPAREASDLGAAIEWFEDQPPAINESKALIHDKAVLSGLALPDPAAGRMNDRVCAVRMLAQKTGATRIVEGWVEGPCAMAADLRGLNTLMLDFGDDPDFVEALFAYAVRMELNFAQAQVDAGAPLIGVGDAAASLVGPRIYQNFVLPFEKRLLAGIRAMGVPVRLHIRKGMAEPGAAIVDLDYPAPVNEARAAMGEQQVLLGNMDPVRALRDGTPESVTAHLEECHAQAGRNYIVGAGCEVPRGTPIANVEAMTRFARTRQ